MSDMSFVNKQQKARSGDSAVNTVAYPWKCSSCTPLGDVSPQPSDRAISYLLLACKVRHFGHTLTCSAHKAIGTTQQRLDKACYLEIKSIKTQKHKLH